MSSSALSVGRRSAPRGARSTAATSCRSTHNATRPRVVMMQSVRRHCSPQGWCTDVQQHGAIQRATPFLLVLFRLLCSLHKSKQPRMHVHVLRCHTPTPTPQPGSVPPPHASLSMPRHLQPLLLRCSAGSSAYPYLCSKASRCQHDRVPRLQQLIVQLHATKRHTEHTLTCCHKCSALQPRQSEV